MIITCIFLPHDHDGGVLAQLPTQAVGAPSLEEFKARLDGALGSLSWWVVFLSIVEVGTGWAVGSPPTQAIL